MERPRIKRTTEPIEAPDGDLLLLRPSAGGDVRIEQPDERDRRLLAAFDGEHTLDQLHEEFGNADVDAADRPAAGAGAGRGRAPTTTS